MWEEYTWIVVLGALAAFAMGWGIGANDVANAFASSVGSKAITMRQALLIAAVFEFAGALALGGHTARTIAGSIAKHTLFQREPEILMYGMLCALSAASIWLYIATYMELAVSTTHSIVGAVMGFALVYGGAKGVVWAERKDEFPFYNGFAPIVMSWFFAPLMSSICSAFVFFLARTLILRKPNAYQLSFWGLPVLVFITLYINTFFVLYKGASKELTWKANKVAWVSAVISAGAALFTIFIILPLLRKKVAKDIAEAANGGTAITAEEAKDVEAASPDGSSKSSTWTGKLKQLLLRGVDQDIHKVVKEEESIMTLHENAEKFDPHAETVFKYLQVFTAICDSFSHGANDVANSIGPFAAIWSVYRTERVSSRADTPIWILVLGALGIVAGLGTYGYNIMRALGVKMVSITPSRGFAIELSTALVISLGSRYGIPLSTTQCQVGATLGVGFLEGQRGVNWKLFLRTFCGWVFTILIASGLSAAIFAQGVYSPSIQMGRTIVQYELQLESSSLDLLRTMNSTLLAFNNTPSWNQSLFDVVNKTRSNLRSIMRQQEIDPKDLVKVNNATLALFRNQSILTIGQNKTAIQAVLVKPPK